MVLPEDRYGPFAVSRGDGATRFITLRNLTWDSATYSVRLDRTIGLETGGEIELRRFHPSEALLGRFPAGSEVAVEVPPFRSCLIAASAKALSEIGIMGCDYEVVRETPDKLGHQALGEPGARKRSAGLGRTLIPPGRPDGASAVSLLADKTLRVDSQAEP
jgi:hypothetical protein